MPPDTNVSSSNNNDTTKAQQQQQEQLQAAAKAKAKVTTTAANASFIIGALVFWILLLDPRLIVMIIDDVVTSDEASSRGEQESGGGDLLNNVFIPLCLLVLVLWQMCSLILATLTYGTSIMRTTNTRTTTTKHHHEATTTTTITPVHESEPDHYRDDLIRFWMSMVIRHFLCGYLWASLISLMAYNHFAKGGVRTILVGDWILQGVLVLATICAYHWPVVKEPKEDHQNNNNKKQELKEPLPVAIVVSARPCTSAT